MTQPKFLSNPSAEEMPRSADVVIIGGGPAGTAALWAIERFAPGTRTVLIEKSDQLGAGSSLASLENFRTCWPALCLARQLARSVEVFHNADEYLGEGAAEAIAIKQQGYLFVAFNEQQAAGLKSDVQRLHEIGLPHIEYLEGTKVAARFGWVGEKVIAVKYDPTAGWLDSNALIYRYAASTRSAQILLGIADVQICVENGRVVGVQTPQGKIATDKVLIAAGASSKAIGRTAGVELPILLRPRQSFTTGWRHEMFPPDAPMIISAAPHPHVRPEARDGAIFAWEYNWQNKYAGAEYGTNSQHDAITEPLYPVQRLKDPRFPSITLALLARQFGHKDGTGFADPRYLRGISHNIGYYVYRDENAAYRLDAEGNKQPYDSERAIIDAVPDVGGLYMSVAHVGHGIMSSPAAGEIAASRLLGLPLPDPIFEQFGLAANWVEYDEGVL
ncbi:MAG: FAD-binding oxidoreductase [Anaerolineae bacterium]|nr:FAD-binding oxidoreductase [Anaerolineae bacterium]